MKKDIKLPPHEPRWEAYYYFELGDSLWNVNVTVTCIYTSASVKEETKEDLLAYPERETVHPLPPKSLFLQPH